MLYALAIAVATVGAFIFVPSIFDVNAIAGPIVAILMVSALIVLWHKPRAILYIVFTAVCLIELYPFRYADALTDQVPFFWNINSIFQRYAVTEFKDFKSLPYNLLELLLLIAGTSAFIRAVCTKQKGIRTGAFFLPILIYIVFVGIGWVNGMRTGGDFKISLMEVRPQFYFLLAYLMSVNIVRERRQVDSLFWIMAICIGIKGILYTFRRYVTLSGLPLPDQGVGSHEEAFMFDTFVVLLIVLSLFRVHGRLRWLMWSLLPIVLVGNLATNRRAGTAALAIAIPILFLAAERALPVARKRIRITALMLSVLLACYYVAFKNSDSMFAQPARALNSLISPNARDASSNQYRDAENSDLMATIKTSPLLGYGYGKRMLHAVPIADISAHYEYWDVMTHNQILWVWMRVGTLGFVAFWMMVAFVVIRACQVLRDDHSDAHTKAVSTFALLVICMLMIFGLLDLQLTNFRDMLFAGFWMGILAALPQANPTRVKEVCA